MCYLVCVNQSKGMRTLMIHKLKSLLKRNYRSHPDHHYDNTILCVNGTVLKVDKKMLQYIYSIKPDISDLNLMVVFFLCNKEKTRFLCEFQLQPIGGSFIATN